MRYFRSADIHRFTNSIHCARKVYQKGTRTPLPAQHFVEAEFQMKYVDWPSTATAEQVATQHVGKVVVCTASFQDESTIGVGEAINTTTRLTIVGWRGFRHMKRGALVFVHDQDGWSTDLYSVIMRTPVTLGAIYLVKYLDHGTARHVGAFVQFPSPTRFKWADDAPPPAVKLDLENKFPHTCPACKSAAYVGFTSIECGNRACTRWVS